MSSYSYSSLPEGSIRLLRLMPVREGGQTEPIECEIFTCQVLEPITTRPYEALSYTWEDDSKDCPISVNGCEMLVTKALNGALRSLRDSSLERIIWIDAICINQEDFKEKGQQIQNLAKIFAAASRVIIWLGLDDPESDQALEELQIAAAGAHYATEEMDDENEETSIMTPEDVDEPVDDEKPIIKLLRRPWFQRIWVLQEVAAARHVLIRCGKAEIEGYDFCEGLAALTVSYAGCPELQPVISSVTKLIKSSLFLPTRSVGQYGQSPERKNSLGETVHPDRKPDQHGQYSRGRHPLSELVEMYHDRKATDRRDKIYALLGMSSDDPSASGISVNYDISWGLLFRQFITSLLPNQIHVQTWDDTEIAIIGGYATVLGEVSSVDNTREDRQNVTFAWRGGASEHPDLGEKWISRWSFVASAKSIQKGDIVCLLNGASQPTIIRSFNDHPVVIRLAVAPVHNRRHITGGVEWPKFLGSVTEFPGSLTLVWDWGVYPDAQEGAKYESLIDGLAWEFPKIKLEDYTDRTISLRKIQLMLDKMKTCQDGEGKPEQLLIDIEKVLQAMQSLDATDALQSQIKKEEKKLDAIVRLLVQQGKELPLLSWAAERDCEATFELLLRTDKLDPDARDFNDRTALSWAAKNGNEVIFKLLLGSGKADLGAQDHRGWTPLLWAIQSGNEVIIEWLVGSPGVSLEARDKAGRTPLSWAAQYGHTAAMRLLLRNHEVRLDSQDDAGRTPLSWAAQYGQVAVVEVLREYHYLEEDLDVPDHNGRRPVSWAAQYGRVAILELLLRSDEVCPSFMDSTGRTPILWAAENGHTAVVKLLIESGKAPPDSRDLEGRTPLSWAAGNGHDAIVKLLVDRTEVDVCDRDETTRSPLSWAAENGHEEVVKLLLDCDKSWSYDEKEQDLRTPVSWAAEKGHEEVVRLLLDSKLFDNGADLGGDTPASLARNNGYENVAKLLVDAGWD